MLRRTNADPDPTPNPHPSLPASRRLIVVDDHPDAGHLIAQLLRRDGFEVAEVSDHQAAIGAMVAQDDGVAGVVASFTTTGTSGGLRLIDALRNHPMERINRLRVLLISDQPRQQLFCLQAGADAILMRPFSDKELVTAAEEMIARPDEEREAYRRSMVEEVKRTWTLDDDRVAVAATP